MKCKKEMKQRYTVQTAIFGISLVITGALLNYFAQTITDFVIAQELKLGENSRFVEAWASLSDPVQTNYHMWNWTNPHDVGQPGYKPRFTQMGPYTFWEHTEKVNITWHDNSTVTYRRKKTWRFDPELSDGTMDDVVTTINIVAVSAIYATRFDDGLASFMLSTYLSWSTDQIFWRVSVRDLMFDGVEHYLLEYAGAGDMDKFAFFYKQNNTIHKDYYTIDTGSADINDLGKFRSVNYKPQLPGFQKPCSNYNGSFGEFQPPKRQKTDVLYVHTPETCRQMAYFFDRETDVSGIHVYQYVTNNLSIDNGKYESSNRCYCASADTCLPSGVHNVSSCLDGAPVFLSFPHFLDADPYYREAVEGMQPEREKHRSEINLEPLTGIQLDIRIRGQLNAQVASVPDIEILKDAPNVIFPIVWFDIQIKLPEDLTVIVSWFSRIPQILARMSIALGILGIIIIVFIYIQYTRRQCEDKNKRAFNHEYSSVPQLKQLKLNILKRF